MTKITLMAALGVASIAAATAAQAGSYVITDITAPSTPVGDYAYAAGVNDKGQVLVLAVNPLVGTTFVDVADVYDTHTHGFTAFPAAPGALPSSTELEGLNDAGTVVGAYASSPGVFKGFAAQGGVFSSVDPFGSTNTQANGVSNTGEIVGFVGNQAYTDIGGVFSIIATGAPASSESVAIGVNDAGVVDGQIIDISGGVTSFLDVGGAISSISDPGQSNTAVGGLDDLGVIVGAAGTSVGFNYTTSFIDNHGVFTDLVIPGAIASDAADIDDRGDIVGSYTTADGMTHAFLATYVPEPATWTLMLAGFAGLGMEMRRRRSPMPTRAV